MNVCSACQGLTIIHGKIISQHICLSNKTEHLLYCLLLLEMIFLGFSDYGRASSLTLTYSLSQIWPVLTIKHLKCYSFSLKLDELSWRYPKYRNKWKYFWKKIGHSCRVATNFYKPRLFRVKLNPYLFRFIFDPPV